MNRRTEVSVSTPAASMSARARSAGDPGATPLVKRLAWASTTMPVTWWPTMSWSSRARSRRSFSRALGDARPSFVLADVEVDDGSHRGAEEYEHRHREDGPDGPGSGPQRHRPSGDDHQHGHRPAQARRADEHGSEEHRHHDELGEEAEPQTRRRGDRSRATRAADAAVATQHVPGARPPMPRRGARSLRWRVPTAAPGRGSRTPPPMIQRSTTCAAATTTTSATLSTMRNGVATRARSTPGMLMTRARRTPRPIGRCAVRPTTV